MSRSKIEILCLETEVENYGISISYLDGIGEAESHVAVQPANKQKHKQDIE